MNGYDGALAQLLRMPEVTPGHEVSKRFGLARRVLKSGCEYRALKSLDHEGCSSRTYSSELP